MPAALISGSRRASSLARNAESSAGDVGHAVAPRLLKAGVDRKVRGEEGASDHAPAWIVLR